MVLPAYGRHMPGRKDFKYFAYWNAFQHIPPSLRFHTALLMSCTSHITCHKRVFYVQSPRNFLVTPTTINWAGTTTFGRSQVRPVRSLSVPRCHLVAADTGSRPGALQHGTPPVCGSSSELGPPAGRDTDATGIQISVTSVSLLNLLLNVSFHRKCYTEYFQRTNSIFS